MPADEDEVRIKLAPDVSDLLGSTIDEAFARFGPAVADRRVGADRWLLFKSPSWTLRLRIRPCSDGGHAVVRSWTAHFAHGFDTVPSALHAMGLAPQEPSTEVGGLRLPLRDTAGRVHSLTASGSAGRVFAVSGFDEPPDW